MTHRFFIAILIIDFMSPELLKAFYFQPLTVWEFV